MRVESVQVGSAEPSETSRFGATGIDKVPVAAAAITAAGLVDDAIVNTTVHGGPDQAVYVYTRDDYTHWEGVLARPLPGGTFGENLTIIGISSSDVMVGDRFCIGEVTLEATAARIPCPVFSAKMHESDWRVRFRDARRPGFYCRVIAPGIIEPEMEVRHEPAQGATVSILETQDLTYDLGAEDERIRAALDAPISIRLRSVLQRRLDHPRRHQLSRVRAFAGTRYHRWRDR
jgi:MOSC domain-containing protein YiiM